MPNDDEPMWALALTQPEADVIIRALMYRARFVATIPDVDAVEAEHLARYIATATRLDDE